MDDKQVREWHEKVDAACQDASDKAGQPDGGGHDHAAVLVPIPDHMAELRDLYAKEADEGCSEFGRDEEGRVCFRIDACIVDALKAVWAAGYRTLGCCCGHGQGAGGMIAIDNGTFSREPRTRTQARYAHIHSGGDDPYRCRLCGAIR